MMGSAIFFIGCGLWGYLSQLEISDREENLVPPNAGSVPLENGQEFCGNSWEALFLARVTE